MIWNWICIGLGCYIWHSEEGSGRAVAPPSQLLAVQNITAHPSTASVPITVLLYNGPLFCGFNVLIKGLSCASRELQKYAAYCYQRWVSSNVNGPAQLMSWCKKANCFGKRGFQQERWRHARIPQPSPWRNVWRKHLFGVLRRMEAKRGLYKKKIFGDLRHLKYGYEGERWKYHGPGLFCVQFYT